MCLAHGTACIFPQPDEPSQRRHPVSPRRLAPKTRHARATYPRPNPQPQSIPQVIVPLPTAHTETRTHQRTEPPYPTQYPESPYPETEALSNLAGVTDTGENSSHIVSPAVAEDSDVLESYLSTIPDARRRCLIRTNPNSHRSVRPVLFNTIPRRPLGVCSNQSLPAMKCELVEKFLETVAGDVVELFFQYANVCFPVFDEASFLNVYSTHKEKISLALLCNLYANALVYWDNSPRLRSIRCPDIRYIWNLANEALHSELFLSPGISTVMAMIINVCGRPSTSIFGNGGMVGTAVALSNALGLNRDPSSWSISSVEKGFRVRIWWLVVLHDRWCSLAYGTPLQIHRAQYDVPFPTTGDICPPSASQSQIAAASIFIALTKLTEVLSRYLEHVYNVSKTPPYPAETSPMALEQLLADWEESLSDDTRRIVLRGTHLPAPGAANFRLAYLAVKLLLRRIQLDLDLQQLEDDTSSPYFTQAQRAAEEIVHLIQELEESQLRGFWIPVHSFSLTSATTFLLRSGLRKGNLTANAPLKIAKDMITALQSHHERFGWDLADNCLANCSELVEKIGSLENETNVFSPTGLPSPGDLDLNPSVLDDLFIGFTGLADGFEI
ncbi:hypothetical protein BO71DRAFT_317668 [Aspergillus ellipticus CBS 707.79]|uniref:Xylanolytic transcriptional activator regulatory domain-containing protein n=1 Tax=Aspergillus ellipticus CBS 707.79 TaxID=1448320 RepID=A0A319E2B0_9EURO|nr:hypothetical protein BO71DRAFT_317668 [Aspergillus ellipticus CBS 707.79]